MSRAHVSTVTPEEMQPEHELFACLLWHVSLPRLRALLYCFPPLLVFSHALLSTCYRLLCFLFFLSTLALSGHLTAAVCITTTLLSLFFVFLLSLIFLFFLATFTDSLISLSPSSKPGAAFNQPLLGFTAVVTVIILSQDHFLVNLDVYSALSNFYTVTLLISIMNGKDLIISKHH